MPVRVGILLWLTATALLGADSEITADEVMARVAENQERAVEARKEFVFTQQVRSRVYKGGTQLRHELLRRYLVTPTEDGVERKLIEESGKQFVHGQFAEFENFDEAEPNWDAGLADDLADSFFDESSSRLLKISAAHSAEGLDRSKRPVMERSARASSRAFRGC